MQRQYYQPVGTLSGTTAQEAIHRGLALPLAGGSRAFTCVRHHWRDAGAVARRIAPIADFPAATISDLIRPRSPFAGLDLSIQPLVMGIVNVTPDSFSDGGDHASPVAAIRHGMALLDQGADLLDIGGESTRPGAMPVDAATEAARVLPVITALAREGATVSVDTRRSLVMARAIDSGAAIINDISALTHDPGSLDMVARYRVAVILMHMQGEPATMQDNPQYDDVVLDIYDGLAARMAACHDAGIAAENIMVDPGIGFGKTVADNCQIIRQIGVFHGLGCGVLLGVSRKSFIAKLSRGESPKHREAGSLAAMLSALDQGVQIIRVHDVTAAKQAIKIWYALQ